MKAWKHWWARQAWQANLLVVMLSLLVTAVVSELYWSAMVFHYRPLLNAQANSAAASLEIEAMLGKTTGVAVLLGLNEPLLKELALQQRPVNDPEALARLRVARLMLNAEGGAYVMNREGLVVGHETERESFSGKNFRFRPYWQHAMAGQENVYAAVGSVTGERGLFIAAPIRQDNTPYSPVIGVVVVKIIADSLDRKLGQFSGFGLLISPQGVVFATNEKDWLYCLAGEPGPERIERIRKLKQFGPSFDAGNEPQTLPFDIHADTVRIAGQHYGLAQSPLQWKDPGGSWTLLLLDNLDQRILLVERLAVGAGMGLVFLFLLLMTLRTLREGMAREEALQVMHRAAEQLSKEAELKSRQAEYSVTLQQARDVADLARTFFGQLARFLPVQQGSLYAVTGLPTEALKLTLVGVYGTEGAVVTEILGGEGLLGQCALELKPMVFALPPPGPWRVASGLGAAMPRALLIAPIMRNDKLLGVLELASLDAGLCRSLAAVQDLLPVLAMNLEILLAVQRTQQTLAEAQEQAQAFLQQREMSQEQERWLRAIFDKAPDGMLVVDEQGRIVLANQAMEQLFGYAAGSLTGLVVEALIPERFRERHVGLRQSFAREEGQRWMAAAGRAPIQARHHDGHEFPIAVSLASLPRMLLKGSTVCVLIRPVMPDGAAYLRPCPT